MNRQTDKQKIFHDETMENNNVVIEENDGTLKINMFSGTVTTNHGQVRLNGGKVGSNEGKIRENCDVGLILKNEGTVTTNHGDIGQNYGKVTNALDGIVDENMSGGTVTYGMVNKMAGGTAINCAISKMTGGTARGAATVIDCYEGGRISKAIPRVNITLAYGLTEQAIEWVEALSSEMTEASGPRAATAQAV